MTLLSEVKLFSLEKQDKYVESEREASFINVKNLISVRTEVVHFPTVSTLLQHVLQITTTQQNMCHLSII